MSPFLSFYCRNRIGKKKLRDSIITSAVQQLCLEMTFHVRTTRRVIRRSTCQTSPSARNEVTSDDGSRKTGAASPEGIRLEIIEGPVAFRAFLAVSRSRSLARAPLASSSSSSFRMHRMRDVRECTHAYRKY